MKASRQPAVKMFSRSLMGKKETHLKMMRVMV